LQRFAGTCWTTHHADVAAVVTTSRYTLPAVRFARQSNILLIDGRMLTAWMKRSWSPVPSANRLMSAA
jgi:restriction system protein